MAESLNDKPQPSPYSLGYNELAERVVQLERELEKPIDMLLFCPRCQKQHIDRTDEAQGWTNPPHATHTCQHCGLLWRPSNANTNGAAFIHAEEEKHIERIAASAPVALSHATSVEQAVAKLQRAYVKTVPGGNREMDTAMIELLEAVGGFKVKTLAPSATRERTFRHGLTFYCRMNEAGSLQECASQCAGCSRG